MLPPYVGFHATTTHLHHFKEYKFYNYLRIHTILVTTRYFTSLSTAVSSV